MGDRANIHIIETEGAGIYFYTHWTGYKLPQTLQVALARGKDRWNDETYLNRIIFSEMIKNNVLDETGFGLDLGANKYQASVRALSLSTTWKKYIIPIPDASKLKIENSYLYFCLQR
jgi:hypothetical protein